ncbi:MAG TPA: tetratricopeptide repeat protein [Steroidobacteraceae bacterium]|nr:tetratricopeptide repeat protein [Steroidobacteraceae bacterium]
MSLLFILSILIQVGFIIHVIKTGRNPMWIWVLILPVLAVPGMIAYLFVEVVPELLRGRTAQRARRGFRRALDPGADLRRLENEARLTGNVASRQRYAEELVRHGRYDEAIPLYRQTLTGLYEHDPNLMLGLAKAQFGKADAGAARATLDELLRLNPDFRSPEAHLLYARALEAEGSTEKALEEYRGLASHYPGAEAAVRYAQLLKTQGRAAEAASVARELLEQARIAPAHYRRAQRDWLDTAARLAEGR